ncbi:MAG: choice-of-anchor J domain-containing protein [Nonlabens sp.]|nr:choice-of-anchor J domain-containing protein [Nonlabens sp.]
MKQIYLMVIALLASLTAMAQCNYQLVIQDNFGGSYTAPTGVNVSVNGTTTFYTITTTGAAGRTQTFPIQVNTGDALIFDYTAPAVTGDMQWLLRDSEGFEIFNSGFNPMSSADFSGTASCPTCPAVTNALATTVTANSASIGWTQVGNETEWVIEFGVAPYTQGSGGVVINNVTTNPFTVTGLAANTTYDFCVRSVCGPGDVGRNSCGSFTTTPSCPAPGAVTPVTQRATEVEFIWDANGNTSSDYEINYAPAGVITAPGTGQGTVVTGSTAPFAIVSGLTANTNYDFYIRIDCGMGDFSAWTTAPYTARTLQSCPDISGVTFSNVQQTQVDIAWTAGGSETAWSIEYGAPGFTPGTGTTVAVTTNPYTLTGLSSGTFYSICVTAVCAANDQSTPVCANVLTPADYCNGDLFVDSGGVSGDYENNANITYNICPDNPGDVVYVNFTFNDMEELSATSCYDGLTIYDGPDTTFPTIDTPSGSTEWCWDPANNTGTGNLVGEILIGTTTSGCLTFVFTSDGSVARPGWSANVTCAPPPTCPLPSDLTATSVTESSITLGWTAGGSETSWQIEYGAPGFAPGTGVGTVVPAATNPFTIPSLTSNTPFDFYVNAVCGPGDVSIQRGPASARTSCVPFAVPFTEGFNSASPTKSCWIVRNVNADADTWDLSSTLNPFEGNQSAVINTDFNNGNDDDYLISPGIILTGNQRLRYNYRVQSATEPNNMEVLLSTTGNAPADFTNVLIPATQYSNIVYAEQLLDLSAYTGTVYIAWRIPPSAIDGWRMYIDNVRIDDIPTCPDPAMITNSAVTATTANIGWAAQSLATAVSIEYGPCGFVPGTSAAGAVTVAATSNPFTLTGLTAETCYEAYVTFDCSGSSSIRSVVTTFTTECNAVTAPYLADFENFTATTSGFPTAADGFVREQCWSSTLATYNWVVAPPTLTASGGTGPAPSINTGNYMYTEASNGTAGAITNLRSPLIDLAPLTNPVLEFDYHMFGPTTGSLAVVASVAGVETTLFTLTGQQQTTETAPYRTATVSLAAYSGQTVQLILRGTRGTDFTGDIAIDNFAVEEAPACPNPLMITNSAVSATSATLAWAAEPLATTVSIEYGPCGFLPGTSAAGAVVVTATSNPFVLAGLTPNTCYDAYITYDCSGTSSVRSQVNTFRTLCNAFAVPFSEGFNSSSTTESCWTVLNVNGDADAWDLNYTPTPFEGDQSATITTDFNAGNDNDYLISPGIVLTGNQRLRYHYRVQSAGEPNNMEVLLSTTGVAPGDFTNVLLPATTFSNTVYAEQQLNLSAYTGTVYIAWRIPPSAIDGWIMYVDNVRVDDLPACPEPIALNVNAITATTASFGWTENGSATVWEVEVQPTGVAQGTAGAIYTNATATNRQTITGLSATTTYSAYVRAVCSATSSSIWSGPLNFTTPCAVFPTPYGTQGGAPGNDFTVFPGTCWTEGNDTAIAAGPNGADGAWVADDFGNVVGGPNGRAAKINIYDSTTVTRDWLVSPAFDLGAAGNRTLNFQVAMTNWNTTVATTMGSDDEVQLLITTDNGATWNNLTTFNASTPILATGQSVSIPLATYTGNVRFAFWSSNGTVADAADVDFFIDNFRIDVTAGVDSPQALGFVYYPNPTTGLLNVVGNDIIDSVQVRNLLGQVIFSAKGNSVDVQLDLSGYPTGVYLLEVISNSKSSVVKVIKE